jgi:hypothetical protein
MSACSGIDLGASGCYFGEGLFAEGSKPRYVILYSIGRKIPYEGLRRVQWKRRTKIEVFHGLN